MSKILQPIILIKPVLRRTVRILFGTEMLLAECKMFQQERLHGGTLHHQ